MREELLIRKELAESFLQRNDLDCISRKEWEKELEIVNNKLAERGKANERNSKRNKRTL